MSKNAVMIDGQRYPSARDAADTLRMNYNVLMRRLKSDHSPDWIILKNRLSYVIDGVSYESLEAAAGKLDISLYTVKQRLMEMGNGEVITDLPEESQKEQPSLLKHGSKPVSINGVCFPTVSSACYYVDRYGYESCNRAKLLRRIHSDKPEWASWTFTSEADLPKRLPDYITNYTFPRDLVVVNCFLTYHAFAVIRYTDRVHVERFKMIPGVTVDETPKKGKQAMSFKLLDGTYLNIESDQLPPQGSDDYAYIEAEVKRYLVVEQAE